MHKKDCGFTEENVAKPAHARIIIEAVTNHFEDFKEALAISAKIRYTTHIPKDKKVPQIIKRLTEMGSFEVKFAPAIQNAGLGVVDKKLVRIIMLSSSQTRIEVVRSNFPVLADLMQDYFKLK
jgi:hypothetical protein